jgi:hypothetical protein
MEESMRRRVDSDSTYAEESIIEESPERHGPNQSPRQQLRHPDSHWLLDRLLQELKGSIHDYEVFVSKVRESDYRNLFASLTAKEFGSLIARVTMSHQVQVALLLAKKNARFTCEHCVAAIRKTSEYFRSNMVETLLPYCKDLGSNRHLVQEELSEWEQIITTRAFEECVRRRWV